MKLSRYPRSLLFGLVVAVAGAYYVYPLLLVHSEQDACVFGPVTNKAYREYLSKARSSVSATASPFNWDSREFAAELNRLFRDISGNDPSIYSRVAAMHAVLRSLGAEFRNTNGNDVDEGRSEPYGKAATQNATISFNYLLDVNKIGMFSPLKRDAWVIGSLAGPRYRVPPGPLYPAKRGGIAFIVNLPNIYENPREIARHPDQNCPSVPPPELSDSFSPAPD